MGIASSLRLRWRRIAAGGVAGLLLLVCATRSLGPKVPVYQGKDLYTWVAELQESQWNPSDPELQKKVEAATQAIRAMGTNALPFAMADIKAHVTVKDRVVSWLAPRAPSLKLQPRRLEDCWFRGLTALEVLGPVAKPCLPELITLVSNNSNGTGFAESALLAVGSDALPAFTNLLANSKSPQTASLVAAVGHAIDAGSIRPEEAAIALPYLVQVFRSTDIDGRRYAAKALGAIHQQPELCVPLLIEGLTDATLDSGDCIEPLKRFGEAASAYAGKLADIYDKADTPTRRVICAKLANFYSAAGMAVPILVRGLRDPDKDVRFMSAVGLGQLATLPEQAVPALVEAAEDPHQQVRLVAVIGLGSFAPQMTNALSAIQRACSDPAPPVRRAATYLLARLQAQKP